MSHQPTTQHNTETLLDVSTEPASPSYYCASDLGNLATTLDTITAVEEFEAVEKRREAVVSNNYKVLSKRFGETFVKGERLPGGRYAGSGARELLSPFMEDPDLANVVKRLIPSRHEALTTLRDNQGYIAATLRKMEAGDEEQEYEAPKDPYELATSVGYELIGPFEDIDSMEVYRRDFRPGEVICTFNSPQSRLNAYNILWLRHEEADSIVPADKLTQGNLTEPWKEYLRSTVRYDPTTGLYDLDKLIPAREDPYGTSSMSVQISRTGTHISIKNRYNHTVSNPDSTLSNNLDNVADGMRRGVYNLLGRPELMDTANDAEAIRRGYITDNDGGIHKYWFERDNVYLGCYQYIEDGIVTIIDRGAYEMLEYGLYASKQNGGEAIVVADDSITTKAEVLEDGTRNLHLYRPNGKLEKTYSCTYDERGNVINIKLSIAKGARPDHLYNSPVVTELFIAKGVKWFDVLENPSLVKVTLAEDVTMGSIGQNPLLVDIVVATGVKMDSIYYNTAVREVCLNGSSTVSSIFQNHSLTTLSIAKYCSSISNNPSLTTIYTARNTYILTIIHNPSLVNVYLTKDAHVTNIYDCNPEMIIHRQPEGELK